MIPVNLFEQIVDIVCLQLPDPPRSKVTAEARFVEDLGFDKTDLMELIEDLNDELEIDIQDAQAAKATTVKALVALVEKLKKSK